eukprot:g39559.t1
MCRKLSQLQKLELQVSEFEQRLETLWCIHEAQSYVDSTFREMVTPQLKGLEERREWVTTKQSRKNRQVVQEAHGVPFTNQYSVLEADKGT